MTNIQETNPTLWQRLESFDVFDDSGAPDQFLDPITCQLMKNPVRLPGFPALVVDHSTVLCLEKGKDGTRVHPYTRQEISESAILLETELLNQITAWKDAKRSDTHVRNVVSQVLESMIQDLEDGC